MFHFTNLFNEILKLYHLAYYGQNKLRNEVSLKL